MRKRICRFCIAVAIAAIICTPINPACAQTESRIVSVGLFKNGLATVIRETRLNGPGRYQFTDKLDPIHGTYFVESEDPIESMMIPVVKSEPVRGQLGKDLQRELAGATVFVQLRNNAGGIRGEVMSLASPNESDTGSPNVAIATPVAHAIQTQTPSRFLILKTEKGISYIDTNEVVAIELAGQPQNNPQVVTTMRNELVLIVGAKARGGLVRIHYLTNGIAWAPNYRVNIESDKQLSIEQQAIVRNELEELSEAEVSLISGYPNVQFAHLISPFSSKQTWEQFFQQLNMRQGRGNAIMSNSIVSQSNAYAFPEQSPTVMGTQTSLGDTLDLHFQPIGKHHLPKGASLAVTTGKTRTDYSRVVEWNIPDTRDEWGSPSQSRRTDPFSGELLQDDVWDCIKFKNDLPFPMTTAPAVVTAQGRFSGQSQILWTNRNEEATLRVNKALSIRARHVEYENTTGDANQVEREISYLGGRRLRKVTVNGELRLCNHRTSNVNMNIQRQFSGDYVSGDLSPKIDLREEGVWTLNKRNQLTWKLELKPAEERTIKYQYQLLVPF